MGKKTFTPVSTNFPEVNISKTILGSHFVN